MKRLLSLLLVFVMIFAFAVPTFAATKEKQKKGSDDTIRVRLCNYMDNKGNWVKEKYITFDTEPIIINGRTMVPIRAVAEELGYEVDWNPSQWGDKIGEVGIKYSMVNDKDYTKKNQNARLVNLLYNLEAKNGLAPDNFGKMFFDAHKEHCSVGSLLEVEHGKKYIYLSITVVKDINSKNYARLALWDSPDMCGAEYNMDVPAIVRNDRTLLPLRAVGEMLGLDVSWDNDNRIVTISA